MSPTHLSLEGACRCGQTRFRVTRPALLTMACHCRGCQRMTGSAYSLSAAIPVDGFAVTQGEPVLGGLHGPSRHAFCPRCLSWLFTRPEGLDSFVNIRPTMLDDPRWSTPFIETWTREKLRWVTTAAVHSYAEIPPQAAYDALIAEYARTTGSSGA